MTGRWLYLYFCYSVFTKDFEDIRSSTGILCRYVEVVQLLFFVFIFCGVLNSLFLLIQDSQELLALRFIVKPVVGVVDVASVCYWATLIGKRPDDGEGVLLKSFVRTCVKGSDVRLCKWLF